MRKINTDRMPESTWSSPRGTFAMRSKGVSEALGRKPDSLHLDERHPFDVEIQIIPAGTRGTPYHAHSAQWEFYHVIAGEGTVRHDAGVEPIEPGDAFVFKPGEAHQLCGGASDLVVLVVADNPVGESWYYPDSGKWGVPLPGEGRFLRGDALSYFDGEE